MSYYVKKKKKFLISGTKEKWSVILRNKQATDVNNSQIKLNFKPYTSQVVQIKPYKLETITN